MISNLLSDVFKENIKTDCYINNNEELAYNVIQNRTLFSIKHINVYHLSNLIKKYLVKEKDCEIDTHLSSDGHVICIITKLGIKGSSFKAVALDEYKALFNAYKKMEKRYQDEQ